MPAEINPVLGNEKSTQGGGNLMLNKDNKNHTSVHLSNFLKRRSSETQTTFNSPRSDASNGSPKLINAGYFTPPTSPDIPTNCPPTPVHQKTPGNIGDEILKTFSSARSNISKRDCISPTRQNNFNFETIKRKCLNSLNHSNYDPSNSNTRTIMPYLTYHYTSISENTGFIPLKPTLCKPTPTKVLSINRNPYSPCNTSSSYSNIEIPYDSSPARLLLDFHLEQELGKGSFGSVILCTHRMDGWNYAVKCIHFTTCKQRDRLINEVYLMASFSHPNIVEYHSSWMDESNIYIQMEYCNGGSLETWWKYNQDSSFAEKEAKLCKVIQHIALALDYLHTQENAVHLDIKPANIFVRYHSSVYYTYKLGDFGSMQKIPLANECFDYENSFLGYKKKELNLSKIECDDIDEGDGRYLAPELLKDQVDVRLLGRADIYAVGCSILELAGGQLLPNHSEFSSEDASNPPVLLPCGYSVKFASLLSKMLDSDPSKRPSARVLLMDQEIGSTESRILLLQKEVYQLQQENRLMREQLQANSVNCRLSSF